MTIAEAVQQGLITKAEAEWAYDPCDFLGFEYFSHMEYDAAMFEAQRACEQALYEAARKEEEEWLQHLEEEERTIEELAQQYTDDFFCQLPR